MIDSSSTFKLLDTHLHLVYRKKFDYSWVEGIPALEKSDFTIEDYRSIVGPSGVEKAIFMETATDEQFFKDETHFVLSLAEELSNKIIGVIASCRPEKNNFEFDKWLAETKDTKVLGFRRILHTEADELSTSQTFRDNINKIGEQEKSFDLCVLEKQLPFAIELARACDNTQMVLNHCGIPNIATGDFNYWAKHISQLSQLPHVNCKISGVIAYCPADQGNADTLRPYIEHCVDSFGWDRLLWGSDWPVCNLAKGVSDWVTIFNQLLAQENVETQDKISKQNAKRIYNLI